MLDLGLFPVEPFVKAECSLASVSCSLASIECDASTVSASAGVTAELNSPAVTAGGAACERQWVR
jgi:hypothetical protein